MLLLSSILTSRFGCRAYVQQRTPDQEIPLPTAVAAVTVVAMLPFNEITSIGSETVVESKSNRIHICRTPKSKRDRLRRKSGIKFIAPTWWSWTIPDSAVCCSPFDDDDDGRRRRRTATKYTELKTKERKIAIKLNSIKLRNGKLIELTSVCHRNRNVIHQVKSIQSHARIKSICMRLSIYQFSNIKSHKSRSRFVIRLFLACNGRRRSVNSTKMQHSRQFDSSRW